MWEKLRNFLGVTGKVLSKLSYTVPDNTVKDIVACKPDIIEDILITLRSKVSVLVIPEISCITNARNGTICS